MQCPANRTDGEFVDNTIALRVERIDPITPRVRRMLLVSDSGAPLPMYEPGAHIELHVPASGRAPAMRRAYSLVRPADGGRHYEIAVQLEEQGSGGSRWVHQLREGQRLTASGPRNEFPLRGAAQRPLLLAGGIGITPILSMALHLQQQGQAFDMHFVAREASQAAYAAEVHALPNARCWFDGGDPSQGIALTEVIGAPTPGRHLHVCGPKGFIAAVLETANQLGWAAEALHCELFTGALASAEDRPFTVELSASGMKVDVAVGQTVLEAMEAAGLDPLFDCRRGDCGICVAKVLGGEADHRDICLSARERESGSFCICVSRARSDQLVLDL
ncbi:oxidoreductase [Cupriavidus necator]|uniref:Oxidoreductase n=1 Tax=Cupriavidus necator TaxID=106590 RepID=A0A367P8T0_CUPNE|nr:oxidoreductase [Cupriavidus necator]RCJ03585.1 oxidoreductase [Cupriavidus necator]